MMKAASGLLNEKEHPRNAWRLSLPSRVRRGHIDLTVPLAAMGRAAVKGVGGCVSHRKLLLIGLVKVL